MFSFISYKKGELSNFTALLIAIIIIGLVVLFLAKDLPWQKTKKQEPAEAEVVKPKARGFGGHK